MRGGHRGLASGLVVGATLLLCGNPAVANNWGDSDCVPAYPGGPLQCVRLANNTSHAIQPSNMYDTSYDTDNIPGMLSSLGRFADFKYADTVMNMYITTVDPQPDVIATDVNYGNNSLVGWVYCPANNTGTGGSSPTRWCRGPRLKLNSYYYYSAYGYFDTETQRRRVACHELGHTIGLRHRDPAPADRGCMFTYVHESYGAPAYIRGHDQNHINDWYS